MRLRSILILLLACCLLLVLSIHVAENRKKEGKDERENMALQVLKDTAISHIVQVALDKALSCLQNGFELFFGAQNHLVKIKDSLVDIHDFFVIA